MVMFLCSTSETIPEKIYLMKELHHTSLAGRQETYKWQHISLKNLHFMLAPLFVAPERVSERSGLIQNHIQTSILKKHTLS